jgi:predicted RNA-binding Zn-ribbon protein involved in translation (DUF1610 family)
MADLLGTPTLYVTLILLVVFSAVAYFEIKYLKRKRAERAEAKAKVDDIYNQIVTTRAVSNAIKGKGMNTKDADLAILEADSAFSRGSYTEAKASVERAKGLLREAKKDAPSAPTEASTQQQIKEKLPEKCEVPFQETKKLPTNFLESKFMICSVKDQVDAAARSGGDTSIPKDFLLLAEDAFARQDYTEALKDALKAKKALEGGQITIKEDAKANEKSSIEKVPSAVVVHAHLSKCTKCSTQLDPDDMFCPNCGAKVVRDIRCPRCANKVKVDDAYCRKCGLPLLSD